MESKPSPIELTPDQIQMMKMARLKAMQKRKEAFLNDLIELEKKHNLKVVPILNSSINGIIPGIMVIDPEEYPEYASPKAFTKDPEGKVPEKKKTK